MTTAKKTGITKKKTPSVKRLAKTTKNAFKKSDWILIPLGLIVATCLTIVVMKAYVLTYLMTPQFYNAFWFPPFPSLLIAIFGILYIYKTLTRQPIRRLADITTYTLLLVFAIFIVQVVLIIGGRGHMCTNLYGMPAECSQVYAMMLSVFFANPYSLTLLSSLAILGIASLLITKRP